MSASFFPEAAYIQLQIEPGDPDANLLRLQEEIIGLAPAAGGIVVLPELWATGFDYPRLASLADVTPSLLEHLQAIAQEHDIYLAGSLPQRFRTTRTVRSRPHSSLYPPKQEAVFYNTLFLVGPQGIIGSYRKHKLFPFWGEDDFFTPGPFPTPLRGPWGSLATLICYDIRFPSLAASQSAAGAELLVISAQWPRARISQWRILVRARAIENQLFVIASNGYGQCGEYFLGGHSLIVAPDGSILAEAGAKEGSGKAWLDYSLLAKIRSRFRTIDTPDTSLSRASTQPCKN